MEEAIIDVWAVLLFLYRGQAIEADVDGFGHCVVLPTTDGHIMTRKMDGGQVVVLDRFGKWSASPIQPIPYDGVVQLQPLDGFSWETTIVSKICTMVGMPDKDRDRVYRKVAEYVSPYK